MAKMIVIEWIAEDGISQWSRFLLEIDAIKFEESLDAAGLPHSRVMWKEA